MMNCLRGFLIVDALVGFEAVANFCLVWLAFGRDFALWIRRGSFVDVFSRSLAIFGLLWLSVEVVWFECG